MQPKIDPDLVTVFTFHFIQIKSGRLYDQGKQIIWIKICGEQKHLVASIHASLHTASAHNSNIVQVGDICVNEFHGVEVSALVPSAHVIAVADHIRINWLILCDTFSVGSKEFLANFCSDC
ncbi:hypothetical protein BpHYR1_042988 [Brachionus plicatilis]|uniref:Uncharacterized protein n=1 Tax=Brachionus plicatilis TaxID=10195 RepID=A0A3M7PNS8_BRAPC|nr:hypothetical protein BpHYR1_042988 [Brachionus plicatilis]